MIGALLRHIFIAVKFVVSGLGILVAGSVALFDALGMAFPSIGTAFQELLSFVVAEALELLPASVGDLGDGKFMLALGDVLTELGKFNTILPVTTIVTEFFTVLAAVGAIRISRWALSFIPTLNAG